MLISIVTPVLNGAKCISRNLDSLSRQRGNFEHIVMDGGSTDSTLDIVRSYEGKYPMRWYVKRDKGNYEGIWNGVQHSSGEIMAWINADDFYLPWTLATVRAVFEAHPEVDWITGIPNLYSEKTGIAVTSTSVPVYPRSWIRRGWYTPGCMGGLQQESMFWRRSLWDKVNPEEVMLQPQYRHVGDYFLWRRFAKFAELRTVTAVLGTFTCSPGQLTVVNREEILRDYGLKKHQTSRPLWARAAQRLACIALQLRVIRVEGAESR